MVVIYVKWTLLIARPRGMLNEKFRFEVFLVCAFLFLVSVKTVLYKKQAYYFFNSFQRPADGLDLDQEEVRRNTAHMPYIQGHFSENYNISRIVYTKIK